MGGYGDGGMGDTGKMDTGTAGRGTWGWDGGHGDRENREGDMGMWDVGMQRQGTGPCSCPHQLLSGHSGTSSLPTNGWMFK